MANTSVRDCENVAEILNVKMIVLEIKYPKNARI